MHFLFFFFFYFLFLSNSFNIKQTKKQRNKETKKQRNKQANKQTETRANAYTIERQTDKIDGSSENDAQLVVHANYFILGSASARLLNRVFQVSCNIKNRHISGSKSSN